MRAVLPRACGVAGLLTGFAAGVQAQPDRDSTGRTTAESSVSTGIVFNVAAGGFLIGSSRLAVLKAEAVRGRWAVIGDLTRDDTRETWDATPTRSASRGYYVAWATTGAVRRYTRVGGRGLFLEAGAGAAEASLEVSVASRAVTTRTASVPLAIWGAGWRSGTVASRAFVELSYRNGVPLATRHLYTDAIAPAGSTKESISYHSWYFGRGEPGGQFYIAFGLRR